MGVWVARRARGDGVGVFGFVRARVASGELQSPMTYQSQTDCHLLPNPITRSVAHRNYSKRAAATPPRTGSGDAGSHVRAASKLLLGAPQPLHAQAPIRSRRSTPRFDLPSGTGWLGWGRGRCLARRARRQGLGECRMVQRVLSRSAAWAGAWGLGGRADTSGSASRHLEGEARRIDGVGTLTVSQDVESR